MCNNHDVRRNSHNDLIIHRLVGLLITYHLYLIIVFFSKDLMLHMSEYVIGCRNGLVIQFKNFYHFIAFQKVKTQNFTSIDSCNIGGIPSFKQCLWYACIQSVISITFAFLGFLCHSKHKCTWHAAKFKI